MELLVTLCTQNTNGILKPIEMSTTQKRRDNMSDVD